MRGSRTAFGEAFLLTGGDASFIEPLRKQLDNLYAAKREENGRILLPQKHGDQGWYGYTPDQYFEVQRDIYLWSMNPTDLKWLGNDPWLRFLDGKNPDYPMSALNSDFEAIRRRLQGMRGDARTADTRTSDGAQRFSPVKAGTLVNLMLGGNDPGKDGNILHSRLRYFDPARRRAGLPEDVAALVEKIRPDDVVVTLVNTNPVTERDVVVQTGAFAEHQAVSVEIGAKKTPIDGSHFTIRLAPGAGETLTVTMKRYQNQPSAMFPWDR